MTTPTYNRYLLSPACFTVDLYTGARAAAAKGGLR